jgi:hypothetical protein
VSTYELLAGLALEVDGYDLEPLEQRLSAEFTRYTTVIHLRGGGEEGLGEDVTYDGLDHVAIRDAGPVLPLAGSYTLDSFSRKLDSLDLFPAPPVREVSRDFRRWGFESAALDLGLRQQGLSLGAALGREPRPVGYAVSTRLGDPPSLARVRSILGLYPGTTFKLDPVSAWTEELIADLAASVEVDSLDFKGFYRGTPVDQPADPVLYERVARAFPSAWLEDPALTPETEAVLADDHDRITWDAPIHSVADIEALPFPPRMLNFKPSRFGSLRRLCEAYDWCAERGVRIYGGGQGELGVGRGQIQYLASLFHPDTPNDVAPSPFNLEDVPPGLPESPMAPAPSPTGFRWAG